jgi:hypothetical protein
MSTKSSPHSWTFLLVGGFRGPRFDDERQLGCQLTTLGHEWNKSTYIAPDSLIPPRDEWAHLLDRPRLARHNFTVAMSIATRRWCDDAARGWQIACVVPSHGTGMGGPERASAGRRGQGRRELAAGARQAWCDPCCLPSSGGCCGTRASACCGKGVSRSRLTDVHDERAVSTAERGQA